MTMKERIISAVSEKLSPAAESSAKAEVVEELSANLYAKYEELTSAGVDPNEAYERAMDSLGDVNELIDMLGGPTGKAELQRAVTKLTNTVLSWAKAAKEPCMDMGRSIMDAMKKLEVTVTVHGNHQLDYSVEAEGISGLELRINSGSVALRLWDEPNLQVIERSARNLTEKNHAQFIRREDGVLCIQQGNSSVGLSLLSLGRFTSDFEIFLPRQLWKSLLVYSTSGNLQLPEEAFEVGEIMISSTSGDVDLGCGLVCEKLNITAVSGDVTGRQSCVGSLVFRGTSGDLALSCLTAPKTLDAETVSGDLTVALPENEGFGLNFHGVSGSLSSDFSLDAVADLPGVTFCYKKTEPVYRLRTVSGDVELQRSEGEEA